MNKKLSLLVLSLVFVSIFLIGLSSAYTRSTVQYTSTSTSSSTSSNWYGNSAQCSAGQDFVLQIAPSGCTPSVVTSDLLEEQNVPVFCQLAATKINPLIEVEAIDTISFSGEYSDEISGIGFHPAKSALGTKQSLNSAVLENVGYVVVVLKKTINESSMPDYVEANLTAKIKYDVQDAFGVGSSSFYLPVLSDSEWESQKSQFSFWNGKGYLRAESIDETGTIIGIYSGDNKVSIVNLPLKNTSNAIYLPGFDCLAEFKLKMLGLENPDTRARLIVDGGTFEVAKGEKFLENRCRVTDIDNKGLNQKIKVSCNEDEKGSNFYLSLAPRVRLKIGSEEKDYSVGDYLFPYNDRSVYLGYIGSKDNSKKKDDMFVYLYVSPDKAASLDNETISSIARIASSYEKSTIKKGTIAEFVKQTGKSLFSLSSTVFNYIVDGTGLYRVDFSTTYQGYGTAVKIVGFADANDIDVSNLGSDFHTTYKEAMNDYETLITSYTNDKQSSTSTVTYGELALSARIKLAFSTGQRKSGLDFCKEFENAFPDSDLYDDLFGSNGGCVDISKLSSTEMYEKVVLIDGVYRTISFDGIYEPSLEEYSATINVQGPTGKAGSFVITKNQVIGLDDLREGSAVGESLQLISLDENSATININLLQQTSTGTVGTTTSSSRKTIQKNTPLTINGFIFTLTNINLQKYAKVTLIPNIKNTGTDANFNFKIGIEKRLIQLSPDEIKDKIEDLNKTIKQWEGISENLGNAIKGLKTACLGMEAVLTVKNFLSNLDGSAIARKTVMRSKNGWYEICAKKVSEGEYSSPEQCLYEEADNIDADVESYSEILENLNEEIKKAQEPYTEESFLSERVVDTAKFKEAYIKQVREELRQNFKKIYGDTMTVNGVKVNIDEFVDGLEGNQISASELRSMVLNSRLGVINGNLANIANTSLQSSLTEIQTRTQAQRAISSVQSTLSAAGITTTVRAYGTRTTTVTSQEGIYDGAVKKGGQIGDPNTNGLDSNKLYPVQIIIYNNEKYFLVLSGSGNTYHIDKAYKFVSASSSGSVAVSTLSTEKDEEIKKAFTKFTKGGSYNNKYTNAELRYYETEPYKGLPALVPFDLDNGWYASIAQTIAIGGALASYDDSGRVSSFYLCNVGANGLEEKKGGDDKCTQINLGTGQAYNQLSGLSESEATKLVRTAISSIEQASKLYKKGISGTVMINGFPVKIGNPAVDVPEMQCQDYMSPTDCNLLFNVCDPVICPSSRCDYGGTYPVDDVIQSGIIGSILLCLPNFQEGIYIPVCLTGIKAGIDSLLSIITSYRDCLQESLDTGATVGICDEVYSIYLCEFLWKQALPLTKILIPKTLEILLGQNVRGGGEYLGVQSAWEAAQGSVSYFTDYYAANSIEAFKARSTENVGEEICKSYVSGVYSNVDDMIDSLTDPDSPPQYYGRFSETVFSTATNPPTSHYKVYYHIYAGKDSRAYFSVYLKGNEAVSSFYGDASTPYGVASGYIATGEYASETKDFTATSGYKQLCISVNGKEECGFKSVTSNFALDYISDLYVQEQAETTNITSETECVSGTVSAYSLLNLNLQDAAEELVGSSIYNYGITRICSTDNPGLGTDANANSEDSRWVKVGYCDNQNMGCWLDTESVKNAVNFKANADESLEVVASTQLEALLASGDYLTDSEFENNISAIEKEKDNANKISRINAIIDKVFYSNQKAMLFYLRGNAYAALAKTVFEAGIVTSSGATTNTTKTTTTGLTTPSKDINFISSRPQSNILKVIQYAKSNSTGGRKCSCDDNCNTYAKFLEEAGQTYGIDPLLLLSLMMQESSCDYSATSTSNAYGLMQITEDSISICSSIGISSVEDIKELNNVGNNIKCGALILSDKYSTYANGANSSTPYKSNTAFKTLVDNCVITNAKYGVYTGWDAALRGYNGWGCGSTADVDFVEDIINRYNQLVSYYNTL